jgi:hypothetical protein
MLAGESICKVVTIQERNTLKNSTTHECSQQLLRLSGEIWPAEILEMDLNKLANNMSDL